MCYVQGGSHSASTRVRSQHVTKQLYSVHETIRNHPMNFPQPTWNSLIELQWNIRLRWKKRNLFQTSGNTSVYQKHSRGFMVEEMRWNLWEACLIVGHYDEHYDQIYGKGSNPVYSTLRTYDKYIIPKIQLSYLFTRIKLKWFYWNFNYHLFCIVFNLPLYIFSIFHFSTPCSNFSNTIFQRSTQPPPNGIRTEAV